MSLRRPHVSAGVTMGAGRLVIAALGMLAIPLYTRILTPDEYGRLAIAIAVAAAASTIPTQWLTGAALRLAPASSIASVRRRLSVALPATSIFTIGIALAFGYLATDRDSTLTLAILIYALVEGVFTSLWVTSRATLAIDLYVIGGVSRNLLALVFVVVAGNWWTIGAAEVMLCMAAASSIGCLVLLRTMSRRRTTTQPSPPLRKWFRYGAPLTLNYLFTYALTFSDRFIIDQHSGSSSVATYASNYDLLYAMVTLPTSLVGLALVPQIFAESDEHKHRRLLLKLRTAVALSAIVVCATILVVWPALADLLIGPDVAGAPTMLWVGLTASFTLAAFRSSYLNVLLQSQMRTTTITLITAGALALNLSMNVYLIPTEGLVGAVWASLAANALALGSSWIAVRRGPDPDHQPHASPR